MQAGWRPPKTTTQPCVIAAPELLSGILMIAIILTPASHQRTDKVIRLRISGQTAGHHQQSLFHSTPAAACRMSGVRPSNPANGFLYIPLQLYILDNWLTFPETTALKERNRESKWCSEYLKLRHFPGCNIFLMNENEQNARSSLEGLSIDNPSGLSYNYYNAGAINHKPALAF